MANAKQNLRIHSVTKQEHDWALGFNGNDVVTAAGSDPDVEEGYYHIIALEASTSITVDYYDTLGDVRADVVEALGSKGDFIYGQIKNLRVTAGSVRAYRLYPFNTIA